MAIAMFNTIDQRKASCRQWENERCEVYHHDINCKSMKSISLQLDDGDINSFLMMVTIARNDHRLNKQNCQTDRLLIYVKCLAMWFAWAAIANWFSFLCLSGQCLFTMIDVYETKEWRLSLLTEEQMTFHDAIVLSVPHPNTKTSCTYVYIYVRVKHNLILLSNLLRNSCE